MIYESYQRFRAHSFYEYENGPIVGNLKIDSFIEAARKTNLLTKNENINWMIKFDCSKEMKVMFYSCLLSLLSILFKCYLLLFFVSINIFTKCNVIALVVIERTSE